MHSLAVVRAPLSTFAIPRRLMLDYDDLCDPDVSVNERGLSALRFGGLRWLVRRLDAGVIIRTVVSAFHQALLDLVWQGLQFHVNIFPGVA
jgi:hypothetical protein